MASMLKTLEDWRELIVNGDIEIAFEQLKSEIISGKWSTEEENKMAYHCLICANMRASKLLKSDDKNPSTAQQIFQITDFCCRTIEKTWECKSATNFLGCIYIITRYLLDSNNTYEALVIGQYCMEFVDHFNARILSKDETSVTMKNMISIYLNHINKIPINNLETILDVWKFILSPQGRETKRSHFTIIIKWFEYFCHKMKSVEHLQSSLLVMSYLSSYFINPTDHETETFLNICEILIRSAKPGQLKHMIENIACCIEQMKSSFTAVQRVILQFCCDMLLFSICKVDSSVSASLINDCVEGLNSMSSVIPTLRHRTVNFARVLLIQTKNLWISEGKCFYKNSLLHLFTFFTKLSETAKSADLAQIESINEISYFNTSNVVLHTILRIKDWSSAELMEIYSYVKKCLNMSLEVFNDDSKISNSQKTQVYENTGKLCYQVCCSYYEVKLYDEYEELCSMTVRKLITISHDLIQNSLLEPCIINLVIFLSKSNKDEEALKMACIWAAKLPNSRNKLMNNYGYSKSGLFFNNLDGNQNLVNKTCLDFIEDYKKKNQSVWETINFTDCDAMVLLKLELKLIFDRNIYSAGLVQKIVTQSEKHGYMSEMEICLFKGFIFSSTGKFLNNALSLLPTIDNFIAELNLKSVQDTSNKKIIRCYSFLGCLHYVKFRIQVLNARCKNEEEIKIAKSIKTVPAGSGMEVETRDDSDVIHEYLTYKSQQGFIYYLDSAIDFWSRGITLASNEKDIEELEICSKFCEDIDVQTLIQDIASNYRLYCAESREIRAWKLLHYLASIRQDDEKIVYAFSNLVSLNAQVDPEWETKVQQKLPNVEKPTQIYYRLGTIHKLFINGRGIEGVKMLSQISEDDVQYSQISKDVPPNYVILGAKYYLLVSQYTLANFYNVSDYPLKTALRAYRILVDCFKSVIWKYYWQKTEAQSLILDVNLFIIQFHVATSQINLSRIFIANAVDMVKKLGLPMRICKILTILGTVGVITCKCEDIYTKLDALKSVLKFNDCLKEENYDKKPPVMTPATLSSADFNSNTDIRFVSNFDDNYTSPILHSGLKYDMPEFIYHKARCSCVICDDVHYQQISCELMSLFGGYFWMQKTPHHGQALRYFEDALEMSSKLCSRWKAIDRSKVDWFLRTQIVTKMRLGDFWASSDNFDKAEKLNQEALNEYENLMVQDGSLRAQLTDQCLALEYIKLSPKIKQDLPKKRTVRQKLAMKTPACKTTVKVFEDTENDSRVTEMMKNMAITPLPRHSRRLLFKDEDEFCKPAASSRTARIRNKKENTPPDIVMKTPSSLGLNPMEKQLNSLHNLKTYSRPVKNENKIVKKIDADVTQTPSSRTRSRKILESLLSNENNIFDKFSTPAATTSKKILESKISSDTVKINDNLSAAADAFAKKILRGKILSDVVKIDDNLSAAGARPRKERKTPPDQTKINADLLAATVASSKKKKTPYDVIEIGHDFSAAATRSKKEIKKPSDEMKIYNDVSAAASSVSKKKKLLSNVIEIDDDLPAATPCKKKNKIPSDVIKIDADLLPPAANARRRNKIPSDMIKIDDDLLPITASSKKRNKIPSDVIKIDDDLLPNAASSKKKNKIPSEVIKIDDDLLPTTASSEKENKIHSDVITIDDTLLAADAEPAPEFSPNFTIRRKGKDRVPPLNIVKEATTSSRSRLKKIVDEKTSSLAASSSRLKTRKN